MDDDELVRKFGELVHERTHSRLSDRVDSLVVENWGLKDENRRLRKLLILRVINLGEDGE